MPFKFQYTIPETGVVVEHWQESELIYDMEKGIVVFTLKAYVNKEAHQEGKKPVLSRFYEIPEGSNPELAAGGKTFLLNTVRALPEFEGSEDVT